MKKISLILILLANFCFGQEAIYSKAYGDAKNPAIIFLHGGPGYNSVSFEYSTAKVLADKGFYVVVFDQRGCGRSEEDSTSLYTFQEAYDDLNNIYKKYNLKTASLIGHSWGGTLGIMFADKYPEKVKNLVLTGSPLSYQRSFKGILAECKKRLAKKDSSRIKFIEYAEKMDTNSLAYSGTCFMHAMSNGLYSPSKPTATSKVLFDSIIKCPDAQYLSKMTREPVGGFYGKEKYTTLDLTVPLTSDVKKIKVFGIYGEEDGLFNADHLSMLKKIIGENNFSVVPNSSHNIFIDQQEIFTKFISSKLSQ